ncbi:MAG: hypothetical protein AB1656_11620 [Candidatus Omnitrophota bacterium]
MMVKKIPLILLTIIVLASSIILNTEYLWSACYAIRSFTYWDYTGAEICGTYPNGTPDQSHYCASYGTQLACSKIFGTSMVGGREGAKDETRAINFVVFRGCTYSGNYTQPCAEPSTHYAICNSGEYAYNDSGTLHYPVLDDTKPHCLVPNQ